MFLSDGDLCISIVFSLRRELTDVKNKISSILSNIFIIFSILNNKWSAFNVDLVNHWLNEKIETQIHMHTIWCNVVRR